MGGKGLSVRGGVSCSGLSASGRSVADRALPSCTSSRCCLHHCRYGLDTLREAGCDVDGLEFDPELVIRCLQVVSTRCFVCTDAKAITGLRRPSLHRVDMLYLHRGLIVDKDLGNLCKVDRFGCAPAELPFADCHAFSSISSVARLI